MITRDTVGVVQFSGAEGADGPGRKVEKYGTLQLAGSESKMLKFKLAW